MKDDTITHKTTDASTPEVTEVPKISRLKADRAKRKLKKTKKRIKHMQEGTRRNIYLKQPTPTPDDIPEEFPLNESADWDEILKMTMDTHGLLQSYNGILLQGLEYISITRSSSKDKPDTIENGTVTIESPISEALSALTNDLKTFNIKWKTIADKVHGYKGPVAVEDMAEFYLISDNLMMLQADINDVLTDPAFKITEIIQGAIDEQQ